MQKQCFLACTILHVLMSAATVFAAPFSLAPGDILASSFPHVVRIDPNTGAVEPLLNPTLLGNFNSVSIEINNFNATPQREILLQGRQNGSFPTELYAFEPESETLTRISRYAEGFYDFSTSFELRDPFQSPFDADITFVEPTGDVLIAGPTSLIRFNWTTAESEFVRRNFWNSNAIAVLPSGRIVSERSVGALYEVLRDSTTDRLIATNGLGVADIFGSYSDNELVIYRRFDRRFDILNIDTGEQRIFGTLQLGVNPDEFVPTRNGDLLISGFGRLYKLTPGASEAILLSSQVPHLSQLRVVPFAVPEPGATSLFVALFAVGLLYRFRVIVRRS